jgi:hypothetical protein
MRDRDGGDDKVNDGNEVRIPCGNRRTPHEMTSRLHIKGRRSNMGQLEQITRQLATVRRQMTWGGIQGPCPKQERQSGV